ncbi:MAG: shikimate kinase AroL [Thermodesulfobacteriota bacterium]
MTMPRNIVPKGAMQKKAEVEDAGLTGVYRRSAGGAGGKSNIFLVGLRGSGKTTLGKVGAKRSGRPFVDADALAEERAGRSIAELVEQEGWDAFRALESEVLAGICAGDGQIVATGGGVVLAEANRRLMRASGKVFYLAAEPALLTARLLKDPKVAQRPTLTGKPLAEEMRATFEERQPLYMSIADFILHAGAPLNELADDFEEKIRLVDRMVGRR